MREIRLQAVPNQRVAATLDKAAWEITLKACQVHMCATIKRDGETIISGQRVVAGRPIIFCRCRAVHGNFAISTAPDQDIDWREFGRSQSLFFIHPEDLLL